MRVQAGQLSAGADALEVLACLIDIYV
jgi:hypothetical protein